MSRPAPGAYPFTTKKQIQLRIDAEPAFMKECASVMQARTEQRAAGVAPPGKAWGWMSSERVTAGKLTAKSRIGMLSSDEEARLAKLVSRYAKQLADHHRAIALAENPALSVAAEKFGVDSTGSNPPDDVQGQPEAKETAERCHSEPDCPVDDLIGDPEVDSDPTPEEDLPHRVMEFIASNAGLRTDAIARALCTNTAMLAPTLRALVQGKRVRKQGVGRGTRYFVR
ncbi:MAG: hypothetical protein ABI548_25765 [Polyangiaceae bacterium]